MKLDIKFNLYVMLSFIVISLLLLLSIGILLKNATNYYNYQKYIIENTKDNVEWYYNCDSIFQSWFYNCPSQLRNLTGYYCNNTLICQNDFKIKNG